MSSPKISIIMPIYNAEKTIWKSLNSVRNQTLLDIEIVCIDNNSTDNSVKAIRRLQEKDPRIKLFFEKKQGAGPARNKGIQESTGVFIFFLDPDDFIYSRDTLEKLYKLAKIHKTKITGGSVFIYDKESQKEQIGEKKYYFNKEGIVDYKDYQFDWGFWRFIYDRKFLITNNIDFPPYLRGQDTVFFVKAMVAAGRFYAIKEPVYQYNYKFSSKKHSPKTYIDYEKANLEVIEIAKDNNLRELQEGANNHRLPLVSVIIPVFNTDKKSLFRCFESVKNQIYNNVEVIVVDDGSDKETAEAIDRFVSNVQWRVIHQNNKGLSAARNTGYKISTGEYVQFLDSDDFFDVNLISAAVSLVKKTGAEIIVENYKIHNLDDDSWSEVINPDLFPRSDTFNLSDIKSNKIGTIPYNVWSKLFKKSFLDHYNIMHDENLFRAEDVLFSYSALFRAKRISLLPESYITYEEDVPDSNSMTNDKYPLDSVKAWKKLYTLLNRLNLYDEYRKDFEYAMTESVCWHLMRLRGIKGISKLGAASQDFMNSIDFSIQNNTTILLALALSSPESIQLFQKKNKEIHDLYLQLNERDGQIQEIKEQLHDLNNKLNEYLGIKRSARLLAGNVRRRIVNLIR